jgi:hypothetical protein
MTVQLAPVALKSAGFDAVHRLRVMGDRLLDLAAQYDGAQDPRAIPSFCLGRMQCVLADAIEQHRVDFEHPDWVALLSERLHGRWIEACQCYDADPDSACVPAPHREIFRTLKKKPFTVAEALILPLAAHIIHDLPLALIDADFLADATRLSDFDTVNGQLAGEVEDLERRIHRLYDGAIPVVEWAEQLGGSVGEIATDAGFRVTRAWAWYQACRIRDPHHRDDAMREINEDPIRLMKTVRNPPFGSPLRQLYRFLRFFVARLPLHWPSNTRAPVRGGLSIVATDKPLPNLPNRDKTSPQIRSGLATFVDHWPYDVHTLHADGVSSFGFIVDGDADCMREYCQRYFSQPTNGAVQLDPISSLVLVQFARTEHMGGPNNSFPDIGSQNETTFVFFARNNGPTGNGEVVAIAPYIVVDNPMSAIEAREAFGLPKEMGRFSTPVPTLDGDDPGHLSARVMGAPDPKAPGAVYDWYPLVQVERVSDAGHELIGLLGEVATLFTNPEKDLKAVADMFGEVLGEGALAINMLPVVLAGGMHVLSLKEFKDVSSSLYACYQSIVATDMRIQKPRGFRHLNSTYQLTFADLGTHPIRGELGLFGTRPARLSFAMGYDLDLTGAELR